MSCSQRLLLSVVLAAVPVCGTSAMSFADEGYSPRQYYSDWHHQAGSTTYYRHYYYKPTPSYSGYKHHYVVHYASHPQHHYYYNPYKKTFWGRCNAYGDGKPEYSQLPAEYQRGSVAEIPENAFPPPAALPAIPESNDGGKLDLPPDDRPPQGDAQPAAAVPAGK